MDLKNGSPLTETIAAIATPVGQGGVGIIRISGSLCEKIAQAILDTIPLPRQVCYANFKSAQGEIIDQGIALFFKAPHSFTGEDVLELQGHGSPVTLDRLLKTTSALGARLATPGEFSKRAFLNNKIDLAQAEAIADLIAAQSEDAARAAIRSLRGDFSTHVNMLLQQLIELRMYVEAAIDFPEEEIDFLSDGIVRDKIDHLLITINQLEGQAKQGSILREGLHIVITGQPNAGKSSLLNALAGREVAIVTPIPGTTRDIIKENIICDGIPIHILDTAGIRESTDVIEQEGIRRAKEAIKEAQAIFLVVDASTITNESLNTQLAQIDALIKDKIPITVIFNKIDVAPFFSYSDGISLSAKTYQGLDKLKTYLKNLAGVTQNFEGAFLARRRHLEAIAQAKKNIQSAKEELIKRKAGELIAEELRHAQHALGEITGVFTADDLLGKIFSSFCIGK